MFYVYLRYNGQHQRKLPKHIGKCTRPLQWIHVGGTAECRWAKYWRERVTPKPPCSLICRKLQINIHYWGVLWLWFQSVIHQTIKWSTGVHPSIPLTRRKTRSTAQAKNQPIKQSTRCCHTHQSIDQSIDQSSHRPVYPKGNILV